MQRVLALARLGDDLLRQRVDQLPATTRARCERTVFSVAEVSLTSSIGPPGSASEIAIPATNGPRLSRVHSSSPKSALVVIGASSVTRRSQAAYVHANSE